MMIDLELDELEFAVSVLGPCHAHPIGTPLYRRLAAAVVNERRSREPVKVTLKLPSNEWFVMLNPVSYDVEVRRNGEPVLVARWDTDGDFDDFHIVWKHSYPGKEHLIPKENMLTVLSAALRGALLDR